jgi:hypothetical protein
MANDRGVSNNHHGDGFDLIADEQNAGQTKFNYAGMVYICGNGTCISTLDLCVLAEKAHTGQKKLCILAASPGAFLHVCYISLLRTSVKNTGIVIWNQL